MNIACKNEKRQRLSTAGVVWVSLKFADQVISSDRGRPNRNGRESAKMFMGQIAA